MPYVKNPISFTVTEWPTSPGSQTFYFNDRTVDQNVGRLLMIIAEHLYEARQPITSQVSFSLINAFSPLSKVSYGYDERPNSRFYTNATPLVLTFALTKDKFASEIEPKIVRKPYRNMFLYGSSVFNRSKYLTLKITPEMYDKTHLKQLLISNLRYIYFVVGAFTKNFVRHSEWYSRNPTFINEGQYGISSLCLNISIPMLFKNFSFPYWAYNKQVWENASNLIVEEHLTDNLLLYYVTYINVEPRAGDAKELLQQRLATFLQRGLNEVKQFNISSKAGIAVLLLLRRAFNKDQMLPADENQWAADAMFDIKNLLEDRDTKQQFLSVINRLTPKHLLSDQLNKNLSEVMYVFS